MTSTWTGPYWTAFDRATRSRDWHAGPARQDELIFRKSKSRILRDPSRVPQDISSPDSSPPLLEEPSKKLGGLIFQNSRHQLGVMIEASILRDVVQAPGGARFGIGGSVHDAV